MQDHAQINKYIYIYIYTPLPVSRVFGARSGSPRIILEERHARAGRKCVVNTRASQVGIYYTTEKEAC